MNIKNRNIREKIGCRSRWKNRTREMKRNGGGGVWGDESGGERNTLSSTENWEFMGNKQTLSGCY